MTSRLHLTTAVRRRLGGLRADDRGTVAVFFGIAILVVFGLGGLAIDYGQALRIRTRLQQSTDAAALAAASTAAAFINGQSAQGAEVVAEAATLASDSAAKYFGNNAAQWTASIPASTVAISVSGDVVTANISSNVAVQTSFAQLFGVRSVTVGALSAASVRLQPYVEVTLLIDTSGSMALGASAGDQSWLQTNNGCAFACHDGSPVNGYADAYSYALANGITLRYGALNQGILALMDKIDQIDPGHQFVSTSVLSFDNALTVNTSSTMSTATVRANLPNAPATSSMTAGATHFNEIIADVMRQIGPSGDGSSASSPKRLLIIATDGAEDPGRYWVNDIPSRALVAPFDMSFCGPAKQTGVQIGIIHTPYLPMTYDWGYNATLGQPSQIGGPATRADDIAPVLAQCAGNLYVQANDTATIRAAFTSIFGRMSSIVLTK